MLCTCTMYSLIIVLYLPVVIKFLFLWRVNNFWWLWSQTQKSCGKFDGIEAHYYGFIMCCDSGTVRFLCILFFFQTAMSDKEPQTAELRENLVGIYVWFQVSFSLFFLSCKNPHGRLLAASYLLYACNYLYLYAIISKQSLKYNTVLYLVLTMPS